MKLVTTLALAPLRGPAPLAKSLSALDILSGGHMIDEAVRLLKALLQPGAVVDSGTYYATPTAGLSPSPQQRRGIPLWIGSWGSPAGLHRVARLDDGWLASAYSTPRRPSPRP
jgi:alkanesulfonate monooxygenase SsuD/methylene tetrahydromethanopterin reductase-like flavin-dependent oxidoreductase (luciferase family)